MAGLYNFSIEQGSTFEKEISWRDSVGNIISLVGYTAKMQIRDSKTDAIIKDLESNITISNDLIKINMTALETAIFDAVTYGTFGNYDLLLEKNGVVTRLIQGRVSFSSVVTK